MLGICWGREGNEEGFGRFWVAMSWVDEDMVRLRLDLLCVSCEMESGACTRMI